MADQPVADRPVADQPVADQPRPHRPRPHRLRAHRLAVGLACLAATACTPTPSTPSTPAPAPPGPPIAALRGYFTALNAAGSSGTAAQSAFLRATQHPQFTDRYCDNGQFTYTEDPAWSTVRADRQWAPDGATPPSGAVYALAALLTARQNGEVTTTQIVTVRVAVLGGRVYGFSPCTVLGGN